MRFTRLCFLYMSLFLIFDVSFPAYAAHDDGNAKGALGGFRDLRPDSLAGIETGKTAGGSW